MKNNKQIQSKDSSISICCEIYSYQCYMSQNQESKLEKDLYI